MKPEDLSVEPIHISWFDHRKSERLPLALSLSYVIRSAGGPLKGCAKTIDIGGSGVRFLMPRMIAVETPCDLQLRLPGHTAPLSFRGHVAWCRPKQGSQQKQWEVGVAFTFTPSDDGMAFEHYCHFIAGQLLLKHVH